MASIGGLSSSTSSSISSLRGYGGLASGLDRDELIEGMTSGTQTKITKQEQAKTKLEWQQEAYRNISDKMIAFADKYTATMSSSTNLFSDVFWGAASTTALGTNSKFIGVSGSSKSAAANISILGVMQMANNTKIMSSTAVSDRTLTTGTFKIGDADNVSLLAGKNIEIKVGEKSYTISLPYGQGDQYDTVEQVTKAINDAMANINVSYTGSASGKKLSEMVSFGYDTNEKKFTFQGKDSNDIILKGGTALSALGFDVGEDGININSKVFSNRQIIVEGNTSDTNDLLTTQSFAERMGGKSLTFNYNGTSRTIELPTIGQIQYTYDNSKATGGNIVDKFGNVLDKDGYAFDKDGNRVILNEKGEVLDKNGKVVKGGSDNLVKFGSARKIEGTDTFEILDKEGNVVEKDGQALKVETRTAQLDYVKEAIQQSLDAAFGKGRVKAEVENENTEEAHLTFRTTTPDGQNDASSTISITEGSASLMASRGGMGIVSGENNRLNLNTGIKNSGLSSAAGMGNEDTFDLEINGEKFTFTANDSISTIMNKINNSDAGVTISYMSMADKFVVEATENGAAGELKITGTGADLLFGGWIDTNPASDATDEYKAKLAAGNGIDLTKGQDAVLAVKYAGSDEVLELTRGSNNFSIDGLDVTLKGKFGGKVENKETGKMEWDTTEAVTFETNVSSEKMVSAISDMVKEYNEILELVNSQLSTRPDSDYFPLTDDQKKEMSESEIKLWEEKAKAGILFGSSELRSLSDDLRWAILPKDQQAMEALGISVSSSWQDNGKLSFDETKFKAALEKDPDAVKAAFTASDGIASNLKNTMNKYVNTLGATKGILIEKAGSTHAPTSVLSNSLKTEIDDIDKILENLKARLKSQQDRYISQFTSLETLISQMNSQSSYLSSMFA